MFLFRPDAWKYVLLVCDIVYLGFNFGVLIFCDLLQTVRLVGEKSVSCAPNIALLDFFYSSQARTLRESPTRDRVPTRKLTRLLEPNGLTNQNGRNYCPSAQIQEPKPRRSKSRQSAESCMRFQWLVARSHRVLGPPSSHSALSGRSAAPAGAAPALCASLPCGRPLRGVCASSVGSIARGALGGVSVEYYLPFTAAVRLALGAYYPRSFYSPCTIRHSHCDDYVCNGGLYSTRHRHLVLAFATDGCGIGLLRVNTGNRINVATELLLGATCYNYCMRKTFASTI